MARNRLLFLVSIGRGHQAAQGQNKKATSVLLPLPVGEGQGEGTRQLQSYPVTASSIGGFSISVIMVLAISRSPITT